MTEVRRPTTTTGSAGSEHRLAFEPALEGLRGFALLGMLCYHSRFSWAVGGFLPIATFFTLSGYLITSLFLVEWERTGGIRLGTFWSRRFRRLMPAALVTLTVMPLFAVYVSSPDQLARLRGDVFWALFYLANWHYILTDRAYQDLFVAPSPVQHFWSLAIEEQFYFAYPLVAVIGLRLGKGSRLVLGALLGALTVASVLVSVWLMERGASFDRVYYGSDARAAELLLGGILAVALQGRQVFGRVGRRVDLLGMVALTAMLYTWYSVHLTARWIYYGGFAAYSILTLLVMIAAVQPTGFVRALLSVRPLRWIGRVSYGAYLFHWPIYLWLSSEGTGLGPAPLFALRMVVTFGLAGLSYRFIESPIRAGRILAGWRPLVATPSAFATVVVAISLATTVPASMRGQYDPSADELAVDRLMDELRKHPRAVDEAAGLGKALPRIAGFGDSTSLPLGTGLAIWMMKENTGRPREGLAELGCGLARDGIYRSARKEMVRPNNCAERTSAWRASLARSHPDIVFMMAAPWDVCDRLLPGDDVWRAPGDPVLDAYLQREMLDAVDTLASDGALVMWMTHPRIEKHLGDKAPKVPFPESDPRRMRRLNQLIKELETLRPGKVRVVDLAAYMRTLPDGEMSVDYRPDGTHLTVEGGLKLAYEWVGNEMLRLYREESARRGVAKAGAATTSAESDGALRTVP